MLDNVIQNVTSVAFRTFGRAILSGGGLGGGSSSSGNGGQRVSVVLPTFAPDEDYDDDEDTDTSTPVETANRDALGLSNEQAETVTPESTTTESDFKSDNSNSSPTPFTVRFSSYRFSLSYENCLMNSIILCNLQNWEKREYRTL